MASNDELKQAISLAASENGLEPLNTEGMNNKELATALKELRETIAAVDAEDPLDGVDMDAEAPDVVNGDVNAGAEAAMVAKAKAKRAKENVEVERPPYYMAEGKALTSKKGMLGEGDEVRAEYLAEGSAGKALLDHWVDEKFVVKS